MSSLKHVDRIRLEKFLDMGSGYVCDFSDRTFRDFIIENVEIDIYTDGYEVGGTSKANRLLGWKPEYDLDALVEDMVKADLKLAAREKHLKDGGYRVNNYFE